MTDKENSSITEEEALAILDPRDSVETPQPTEAEAKNWVEILRNQGATNIKYHHKIRYLDDYFDNVNDHSWYKVAEQAGTLPRSYEERRSATSSEVTAGFLQNAFRSHPEAVNDVIVTRYDRQGPPQTIREITYLMWVRNPGGIAAPTASAYKPVLFNMYFPGDKAEAFLEAVQQNPDILEDAFTGIYPNQRLPRIKAEKVRLIQVADPPPSQSANSDLKYPDYLSQLPTFEFSRPMGECPLPTETKVTRPLGRGVRPPERLSDPVP